MDSVSTFQKSFPLYKGKKDFKNYVGIISDLYLKVIQNSNKNEQVKKFQAHNDFVNNFKKFCTYSKFYYEQQKRGNVISYYIPDLDYTKNGKDYQKDERAIHLAKTFILKCTNNIRDILDEVNRKKKNQLDGALSEIQYWREISSKLRTLWEQIKLDERVKFLKEILDGDEGSVSTLEIFDSQYQELSKGYLRAKDNIKFLETLERHFKTIDRCNGDSLIPILDSLPSMMRALRMVWIISRHYNTEKEMVPLMVLIANDIIKKVKEHVDIDNRCDEIFSDPKNVINKFNGGIEVLKKWKEIYYEVRKQITETQREMTWDFDTEQLFGNTDYIKERLQELTIIAEQILKFKLFVGPDMVKGFGNMKGVGEILSNIKELIQPIRSFSSNIFNNLKKKDWEMILNQFQIDTKNVEKEISDFITESFEKLQSSQRAFQLLQDVQRNKDLSSLGKVGILKKKKLQILERFGNEIQDIYQIFLKEKEKPPKVKNMPETISKIYWAISLVEKIKSTVFTILKVGKNKQVLDESEEGRIVKEKCIKVTKEIKEYERSFFNSWSENVEKLAILSLKKNILTGNYQKLKSMRVNFDPSLNLLIQETKYLEKMYADCRKKRRIPEIAINITLQSDKFHDYIENLKSMLDSIKTKCLNMIGRNERMILKPKIYELVQVIKPGFTILNWNSLGINDYLKKCNKTISEFQAIVGKVQKNVTILNNLISQIQNTNLFIEPSELENKMMDLPELYRRIEKFKNLRMNFVKKKIKMISQTLMKIEGELISTNLITNDAKKNNNSSGRAEILKDYYHSIEKKIFRALTKMILRSLKVFKRFRKTPGIIKISFTLIHNEITELPHREEVDAMIEKIMNSIVNSTKEIIRWIDGTCITISPDTTKISIKDDKNQHSIEYLLKEKYSYFTEIISSKGYTISKAFYTVTQGIQRTLNRIDKLREFYEKFSQYWKIPKDTAIRKFSERKPTVEDYEERFEYCQKLILDIEKHSKRSVNIDFVVIDLKELLKSIQLEARKWIENYGESLYNRAKPNLDNLITELEEKKERLYSNIDSIYDLRKVLSTIKEIYDRYVNIEREYLGIESIFVTLELYEINCVAKEDKENSKSFQGKWLNLMKEAKVIEKKMVPQKRKFREKTISDINELLEKIEKLSKEFFEGPYKKLDPDAMTKCIEDLATFTKLQNDYRVSEKIFDLTPTNYSTLRKLTQKIEIVKKIYELYDDFNNNLKKWSKTSFDQIQPKIMEKRTKEFIKSLRADFSQEEINLPIHATVKQAITDFNKSIPLFTSLKSDDLRPRHWKNIMEVTKVKIAQSSDFTLKKLIDMKLYQFDDKLQEIFINAKKEVNIEKLLGKISEGWRNRRFILVDHMRNGKNRGKIITGKGDIKDALEEDSTSLAGVSGTSHSIPFLEEIDKWEKILSKIEVTMDVWFETQRMWINLEVIFIGSQDIRTQLKRQAKEFDIIEVEWQKLMTEVNKIKNIKESTNVEGRLELLKDLHTRLQKSQKGLSNYLQSKRNAFPRFFYISDEELLGILGSNDPKNVQKEINKMFNNVNQLIFKKNSNTVIGMMSNEKENLMFHEPVSTERVVEKWLFDVEKEMKKTLKKISKVAVFKYPKERRINWIMENYGQVGLLGSQIWWTWSVENSFRKVNDGEKMAVKSLSKKLTYQISELVNKIRLKITRQQRKKLTTMIIIDVHARDIVDILVRDSILDKKEFEWESQLRFYWDRQQDTCIIRQCTGEFDYGFEYQGLNGRLVITPLTDRCFMTLTQALTFFLGGSPAGPAGTGKTESVKDLAKSMGNLCIVFNCSEGLDYKAMSRIFSGLCQNGAWGCFDEFNRIELPVLSIVSTQIRIIQTALSRGLETFRFYNQDIPIDGKTGIFVTMNPGYAGRVELPDNLKSLFRPITMVVPDSEIICEIMLFSEGFQNARKLSRKMIKLYKLAKGQLSKQRHYDWGLRALKSILTKAGELKREKIGEDENNLLMKALYEMNIAKFIFEDKPLFEDLLKDLFVAVDIDRSSNKFLFKSIKVSLEKEGYQLMDNDYQIYKVTQLYETMNSRHSTMVVGGTTGGKSVVINTLIKAQTQLGYPTKSYLINPKAQSCSELYGVLDNDTREWTDGVLSYIFRKINIKNDNPKERRILIFDGDVDTVWIESMNSVMDDNKLLTLPNSERITLIDQCKLLFEVKNLDVASPATVSRCGMVFVDPKNLGPKPFIWKWINTHFLEDIKKKELLNDLFDIYVFKSISFVLEGNDNRKPLGTVLHLTNVNVAVQLCNILETFIDKISKIENEKTIECLFIFSIFWSIGACVNTEDKKEFDKYVKSISRLSEMNNDRKGVEVPCGRIPSDGTLYDYFFDLEKNCWKKWSSVVTEYVPPENGKFNSIIVPTVDTVRYTFFLDRLLKINKPVLFVGIPGTSKTLIIQSYLNGKIKNGKEEILNLYFSTRTSSLDVQRAIEDRIEKKVGETYAPKANKTLNIFIDDVNMPIVDIYGTQQPIAFLKLLIESGGMYERGSKDNTVINWLNIVKTLYCGAFCPASCGRNELDERFVSLFNIFNLSFPSDNSIKKIFNSILENHMKPFSENVRNICSTITDMTLEVYKTIESKLPPTPNKFHYVFNLRDLTGIYQGLCLSTIDHFNGVTSFVRLWMNESLRIFYDRLNSEDDRKFVLDKISSVIESKFSKQEKNSITKEPLLFGDFNINFKAKDIPRLYNDMEDYSTIKPIVEEKLDEHNELCDKPLDLVLFDSALEHLTRVHRMIRIEGGNGLLIGVGGSGKKSLVNLASYLAGYDIFQLNLCRGYNETNFIEDMKELYYKLLQKKIVFLFSDSDIIDECFLEYINNLLTSGSIPALFENEEKDQICQKVIKDVKDLGLPPTKENLWNFVLEKCKENLHILLCMSPNKQLKSRCRNFPGLINNTTIDWFFPWPNQALRSVASKFLANEILPNINSIVSHIINVHVSVVGKSKSFKEQLRRVNHVTPKNYLDFISTFKNLLKTKRKEVDDLVNRLASGINILEKAEEDVKVMTKELNETKVVVEKKQIDVKKLVKEITKNQEMANEQTEKAKKKEKELEIKTKEIETVKRTSEQYLAEAEPILKNAERALKNLEKKDVSVMKSFKAPHLHIMEVGICICILLSDGGSGEKYDWKSAQRVMGDASFINTLLKFPKEKVTGKKVKKINEIFKKYGKDFSSRNIKDKSVAASGLLQWVEAVTNYYTSFTKVKPLRIKLEKATKELAKSKRELERTKKRLSSLSELLEKLSNDHQTKSKEAKDLQEKAASMERKLKLAQKLIQGLSHEKKRWGQETVKLKEQRIKLVGDCLMASGFLSYLSAFTLEYRNELMYETWEDDLKEKKIPRNHGKKIGLILSNDVEMSQWESEGLESDESSVQNGILTKKGSKFPICIDPQLQAFKWIRNREGKELIIRDFNSSDFYKKLENAIKFGKPFMFENVTEFIDPLITPVLNMDISKKNRKLQFGEEEIEVDDDFKLYLCGRLTNPIYNPEIQGSALVINYSVTEEGLVCQLLNEVVKNECPQLESQRKELIDTTSKNKSKLASLEKTILKELNMAATSDQSLIENEDLVKILDDTKSKAEEINEKLKISKETAIKIDEKRQVYRKVAIRGAILFFVMSSLSSINSMYEYSLESFMEDVFRYSLKKSEYSNNLNGRLENIINFVTKRVYEYVCTGLFEKDKLTFSMLLAIRILQNKGEIKQKELDFFLKGNISLGKLIEEKPFTWISERGWKDLLKLTEVDPVFSNVVNELKGNEQKWKRWYDHETPEAIDFPCQNQKLTNFQKLLLLRCFRIDRIISTVILFISSSMKSNYFVRPPILEYKKIFKQSVNTSPIVCMISPGFDPAQNIIQLAERINQRCDYISLGQGQGENAKNMIIKGMQKGSWVLLQNCHLLIKWMVEVEKILNNTDKKKIHSKFRLWMTSEVTNKFPSNILQKSLKVVTEPPNSLKLNMVSSYSSLNESQLECPHKAFKPLIFVLTYFHAVIQERKKYGKIGWNVPYDFNNSDYIVSLSLLKTYLEKASENNNPIPWSSLKYLVGEAMYGGRVTDDFDRRVLITYLNEYMGDFLFDDCQPFHFFQNSEIDYKLPPGCYKVEEEEDGEYEYEEEEEEDEEAGEGEDDYEKEKEKKKKLNISEEKREDEFDKKRYLDYIEKTVKLENSPDIIGLHPNASISYLTNCTRLLWENLITIQKTSGGQSGGEGSRSRDDIITELITNIDNLVPIEYVFDRPALVKKIGMRPTPPEVVLLQEIEVWNKLVLIIRDSIRRLKLALSGEIRMSSDLEEVGLSIFNGQIPILWKKAAPPTKKNLGSWLIHFKKRYQQYAKWISDGKEPNVMWLSGLHVPESYLTSIVQVTCKKYKWPLDKTVLFSNVTNITSEDQVKEKPEDGCYVSGLFLEGASWNINSMSLEDQKPKVLIENLPIIKTTPIEVSKLKTQNSFNTPVYFTSDRTNAAGEGFCFKSNLSTDFHESHWILKGVAIILNDD